MRVLQQRRTSVNRASLPSAAIVPATLIALNLAAIGNGASPPAKDGNTNPPVQQANANSPTKPPAAATSAVPSAKRKLVVPVQRAPVSTLADQLNKRRLAPADPAKRPLNGDGFVDDVEPGVHLLTLKLGSKRQRCPIELDSPESKLQIRPTEDFGIDCELEPEDGTFDAQHSAVISFPTMNPARIEVSVNEVTDGDHVVIINLDFLVNSDLGRSMRISSTNLKSIRRRTESQGRKAQAALAALEAENIRLEAWVNSSIPVPYLALKRGEARIAQLKVAIPETTQRIESLRNQFESAKELIELADALDGSQLEIAELDAIDRTAQQ